MNRTRTSLPGSYDGRVAFQISGIDHIVLNCADIDATAAWYQRALGVQVETYGAGRTALVFGSQKINLRPVGADGWETATSETPGALDICFETDATVAEILATWQAAEIAVQEGPVQRNGARGPITSIYTLDPDGNLVEVAHYSRP
ncbi:VOC family protein [Nakamurella lactea]|uniref:VOC family protein n=1 Tax=Nakamurella lactea TaxID=459515 RepID=UPI001FE20AAD|nr:VOC family protein [Nakamurella lactea]